VLSLEVMSQFLPTSTSANSCKPANKQKTIISYFSSLSNEPKRKRRNLEVISTVSGNTLEMVALDKQNVAVEKVIVPCHVDQANDDRCLKLCTGLNDGSRAVSSKCSQQSDSESSDIIPPSPLAASNISLNTTCTGKMKMVSDECVTAIDSVSHTVPGWSSKTTMLDDTVPDDKGLSIIEDSAEQRLNEPISEQHQQEMREVDKCHRKSTCHSSERDEDVCDKLLSVDTPSPVPAEVDSDELCSNSPAPETDIADTSERPPSTRRHFMEKVIFSSINIFI